MCRGKTQMNKFLLTALAVASVSSAFAVTINFDDLADDAILGNQYAGLGVTFSAGHTSTGIANPTFSSSGWATNSSMEVATIAGGDIGGGVTAPMSGTVVHSFDGWLSEDGDPSVTIDFATAISSFSVDFGGVAAANLGFTGAYAIDGANNVVASALVTASGTSTVSMSGLNVNRVVLVVGDFGDWVGFDNVSFEPVPEPATMTLLALGALAARRRKKA